MRVGPKAFCVVLTVACASLSRLTSQRMAIARPPLFAMAACVAPALSSLLSTQATAAPAAAKAMLIARPMPPPAPVMIVVRSSSLICVMSTS
jgi:hypothetical protein